MIKSTVLYTYEIDDAEAALCELKSQLSEKLVLMKNTVGIMMCDPEFIMSGVMKAVCDGLPFSVAGTTTMSQAVCSEAGSIMLTVMVLTSDDVMFEAAMTESIGYDIISPTEKAYQDAVQRLGAKTELIIAFPPLILENAGDRYIEAFQKLCPDVPVFGTLAVEDSLDYQNTASFCNGESGHTSMSFILVSGNVSPRFFIATVSEHRMLPYRGEITRSEENIVYEINGEKASRYFENIGLAKDGVINEGVQFIPFIVDFKKMKDYDNVPVVRALVQFDENGAAICRGNMYQNSVFSLSTFDADDVLETTLRLVDRINSLENVQAVLMFSCLVRRMAFGFEPLTEAENIVQHMKNDITFLMGYSGGEICPTSVSNGAAANRFHNYSLIACVL